MLASNELWAQERTVSGKVTSAEDASPLPGVNVVLKGTTNGTVTDSDGNFRLNVPQEGGVLVFTFIGLQTQESEIGTRSSVDVQMAQDITQLSEVVVTALNERRETKTLPYATQEIKAKNLNITQDLNVNNALAGKVAGVQVLTQAGSKLGSFGSIRIRGALSLNGDLSPLYVIDGVPGADPNDIAVENIESINVLKGPNANALYGQRGEGGVIIITTKKGSDNQNLSVELNSSTMFDKVAYLPKYQNLYGGGYEGDDSWGTFDFGADAYPAEWEVYNGERYLLYDNNYADESSGPKIDDQTYVPWYAWWPGTEENPNPYYGTTAKYSAQPNNVKDFYDVGKTLKNTVSVSGGNKTFNGRLSYSNLDQTGVTPYTWLKKHFLSTNFTFNATDKLSITTGIRFTKSTVRGDFDDTYGNQTTGSFSSWFNRNLDMGKMKEMKDLTTLQGYSASWNWWGPDYYLFGAGYQKPAFWFNPYTFMEGLERLENKNNFTGIVTPTYKINDKFELTATISRTQTQTDQDWKFPFYLANSAATDLYNPWINSFGVYKRTESENNYSGAVRYKDQFGNGDFDVSAMFGGNIRMERYDRFSAQMNPGQKTGGLIIPDLYTFGNAGEVPTPSTYRSEKQVNSIYGNASFGYKQIAFLDLSARKDWSSALPSNNNGYFYPSVGANLIFSELTNLSFLSFGKVRASWAQVGSDVGALAINPVYPIAAKPFNGVVLQYPTGQWVDPNLKPALNTSFEAGFDTKFLENRLALSFTYYTEKRKDEIVSVSVPSATGKTTSLTNAGTTSRHGIEITLSGDIVKLSNGFTWNALVNFSKYNSKIDALPADQEAVNIAGEFDDFQNIFLIHQKGAQWGQIRGRAIARDDNGNKIIDPTTGLYEVEADHYYGSVIPDFNGGLVNTFSWKGLQLQASFSFQKGGKFFSLSEMWGTYSGLIASTAATNDKGMNVRDAIVDSDGNTEDINGDTYKFIDAASAGETGGVHVTGVDSEGNEVDMYVNGYDYSQQFQANVLPEPFIHNASYIKLNEVSLSYDIGSLIKNKKILKGASIGVIGRNLARFGMSKDNIHNWDYSEMANKWGENANLPGTRSYGVNVKLTF